MPIYEYRCKECGYIFEAFQSIGSDGSNLSCPECKAQRPEKLFSAFASNGGENHRASTSSSGCGSGGFS